jgi:small subunit ribosomal protein S14
LARKASIEKNNRRFEKASRYEAFRKELRTKAVNEKLSEDERMDARRRLQTLPRITSMTRVRLRCQVTGRPRGNYRRFGLCRLVFRQMALEGKLPGVTKASW